MSELKLQFIPCDLFFSDDGSEGMLLVDASVCNIQYLCPTFSTILINMYRLPAALFVDGDVLYSNEGTTQGDSLAMPFYALATIPLLQWLSK